MVRTTNFPENSSQFSAVMARVCGIPSSGTSGPSGVLIWSVGMPRWTGKTLRRGESIPAESCGGDRFDVPLSLCFCSQQAAEQKASELNPPAKRGNPMDAVGAGANVPFVNRPFESEIHGTVNFTYFCCVLLVTWCYRVLLSCYLRPK